MRDPRQSIKLGEALGRGGLWDHCGLNNGISFSIILPGDKQGILSACWKGSNHGRLCVFEESGGRCRKLSECHLGLTGISGLRSWLYVIGMNARDWLVAQGELIEKSQKAEEGCGCQE